MSSVSPYTEHHASHRPQTYLRFRSELVPPRNCSRSRETKTFCDSRRPLRESGSPAKVLEPGVAPQSILYRVHPHEAERAIIHSFVQPGERLIVLAQAGVYDRDVERAPICSSRAIE